MAENNENNKDINETEAAEQDRAQEIVPEQTAQEEPQAPEQTQNAGQPAEADRLKTASNGKKKKKQDQKPKSVGREILEWIVSIGVAVAIAFTVKLFIFDIVRVDGASMENTLFHNDRLIVTKLGYQPHQGDIIILDSNYGKGKPVYYVKRVIATEGQTVDIDDETGSVYVDGVKLDESYIKGTTHKLDIKDYPITVEEGCVFVMGDNRQNSTDSRRSALGQVKKEAILGKAQVRVYPFNQIGSVYK